MGLPAGVWRVGCIGRRAPGPPIGGREPAGCALPIPGRRWKIGCPRTGNPPPVRWPGAPARGPGAADVLPGAAGRGGGAVYTGRGPVCGVIRRRVGAGGACARCCCLASAMEPEAGAVGAGGGAVGCVTCTAGGACGGADTGAAGGGGAVATGALGRATGASGRGFVSGMVAAGGTGAAGAGGRTGAAGVTGGAAGFVATGAAASLGGAAVLAGAAGALGTAAGGTATGGFAAGAAGASVFLRSAASTSPGLEMCERSILVLISGSPERDERSSRVLPPCPARYLRTRSASSTSMELECVFFSVTPTLARTSRISLLLTSSSRAKSLIRILLIRPLLSPTIPLHDHHNPHGIKVLFAGEPPASAGGKLDLSPAEENRHIRQGL